MRRSSTSGRSLSSSCRLLLQPRVSRRHVVGRRGGRCALRSDAALCGAHAGVEPFLRRPCGVLRPSAARFSLADARGVGVQRPRHVGECAPVLRGDLDAVQSDGTNSSKSRICASTALMRDACIPGEAGEDKPLDFRTSAT